MKRQKQKLNKKANEKKKMEDKNVGYVAQGIVVQKATHFCVSFFFFFVFSSFLLNLRWKHFNGSGENTFEYHHIFLKNDMSTTFLQQILSDRLLLVVIVKTKK